MACHIGFWVVAESATPKEGYKAGSSLGCAKLWIVKRLGMFGHHSGIA
jgi:hypothetical protein